MFFIKVSLSESLRTRVRAVSTLAAIQGTSREAAIVAAFLITLADVGLGPMQTSRRSLSRFIVGKCTLRPAGNRRVRGPGRRSIRLLYAALSPLHPASTLLVAPFSV
jgi:hypothetical protein